MIKNGRKILIVRLSSIGDILLTSPFIRCVRTTFPNARIDFVIKKQFSELLSDNPHLDNLYTVKNDATIADILKLRKQIVSNNYKFIFDLHNNFRSNLLLFGISARYKGKIVKDKKEQIKLVYGKKNSYKNIISVVERYFRVGYPVGVQKDKKGLELYWRNPVEREAKKILEKAGWVDRQDYFAIAPGAGFFTKRWPLEYYEKLIELISKKYGNIKIVILGGITDQEAGRRLAGINNGVVDLTGKLTLLQSGAVLSKCKMLVANDSGMMHMASAVNTPVLAIFGSSVRELGFSPYGGRSYIVENRKLDCRPCSHIGRKSCPKEHFRCMLDLTPEWVFRKFEQLYKKIKRS